MFQLVKTLSLTVPLVLLVSALGHPARAFPTPQPSAVGYWLQGWIWCFSFAHRKILFSNSPEEASASHDG